MCMTAVPASRDAIRSTGDEPICASDRHQLALAIAADPRLREPLAGRDPAKPITVADYVRIETLQRALAERADLASIDGAAPRH